MIRYRDAAGVLILALALVAQAACASAPRNRMDPNRLTRAEMEEVHASNLYEVVHRLRPRWLNPGPVRSFNVSSDVIVVQGQTVLGSLEALRQLSADYAYAMEYMDGATASASLAGIGSRHVAGAIIIYTQPSPSGG